MFAGTRLASHARSASNVCVMIVLAVTTNRALRMRCAGTFFERARGDDVVGAGLSGRRADDRQPMHSAGAAVRVRARRSAVPEVRPADAGRHGHHVCPHCHTGGGRRRLGRRGQPVWSRHRHRAVGRVRPDAHFPKPRRPDHAAACRARREIVEFGGTHRRAGLFSSALIVARRRDRVAVGALRRTGARTYPDWRRPQRRERRHDAPSACLRGRSRHLARARARARRRRAVVRGDEALARRRRVDQAGPRRCRIGRRRRDRVGPRHRLPDPGFARRHQFARTNPD